MNKITFILLTLFSGALEAQSAGPDMADRLRENGKINVVIAVIALIFLALAGFMVYLDRRIGKMEKKVENGIKQRSETPRH